MFDRDDNIYGGNGGILSGLAQTAVWLGVPAVGAKLILDKNAFNGAISKAYDYIAPMQPNNLSSYDRNINSIRDMSIRASRNRVSNAAAREASNHISRAENIPTGSRFTPSVNAGASGVTHDIGSINFNHGSWDNIKDLGGKNIGGEIRQALSDLNMGLNLDAVTWKGTQAVIPISGEKRPFTMEFAAFTDNGKYIIKKGSSVESASVFYQNVVNNGKLTGEVEIKGFNEIILETLKNKDKAHSLAAANVNTSQLITEISNNPRALEKYTQMRGSHAAAMAELKTLDNDRKLYKLALSTLKGKPQFLAATNGITSVLHTGTLRSDPSTLLEHDIIYPGYGSNQVGRAGLHPSGMTRRPTGKAIMDSYNIPLNVDPMDIHFPPSVHSSNPDVPKFTKGLANELAGGITPLVSQGQIPSRTLYAGGQLYGPGVVDGYKAVSPFGYHKRIGDTGVNDWRYRSRYTTNGSSPGTRLANAITENRGNFSKLGYINFAGDEQILLNSRDRASMMIDAPITVGFQDFNEVVANQKITVRPVNGGKGRSFTMGDLYNGGQSQQEIINMMADGQHRITGFGRGTKMGITTDARPISGMEDPLSVEVVGGYKQLKQDAYMGKDELDYFISSLKNHAEGSKYSIPVRTISVQTKTALAGMSARGSVDYDFFNLFNGSDSSIELNRRLAGLFGTNDVSKHVVGTFGSELFKGAIPSLANGKLSAGKNIQELLPFLHNSILGHVEDIRLSTGKNVILKGQVANRFASMTNMAHRAGADFNLTDFIKNGQFIMSHNDKQIYGKHLETSLDVLGAIRAQYEGLGTDLTGGAINIAHKDIAGTRKLLGESWNNAQSSWSAYAETGTAIGGNARKTLWPFMAALSGMENMELSQGAKRFNTAEFGMRDTFMFMGGKEGVLEELLSRNSTDSVRLMRERELMNLSIGGHGDQILMKQKAQEYKKFLLDTYGDTQHVRDYLSVLDETTVDGAKSNLSRAFGTQDLSISNIRDYPEVGASTFLARDKNPFGKLVRTETGGLFHMPSSDVIGGLTVLPDGRVTFEGKHGGHASSFWEAARSAEVNGFVKTSAINGYAIRSAAENIIKNRAAIKVTDALYARNVYDKRLVNHDAMNSLKKYMTGNLEHRSIIGNMASIGASDAQAMIEDQLKQIMFKKSNAVVLELNDLHGTWIAEDHNIANILVKRTVTNKATGVLSTDLKKVAKDIVAGKRAQTISLTKEMEILDKLFKGKASAQQIDAQVAKISSFVAKHGIASIAQRNPVIYPGSVSGLYSFIRFDGFGKGKKGKLGKLLNQSNKSISLGFEAALNMKADWDGDKIQYLMMHQQASREGIRASVIGMQRKTAEYMRETSARMKGLNPTQVLGLSKKEITAATEAIFKQGGATTAAAYMTKAFTGSMNIASLATKGYLEQAINNKTITTSQLEDVLAWTRSIPSLMTEQQVISSKHLESVLSGETAGMSKAEHILHKIGAASQDDILNIIKESGGSVHPVVQMSLAKIQADSTKVYNYTKAIDVANTSLDLETGLRRVTEDQLNAHREYLGHNLTNDQWDAKVKGIMDRQAKFTPLVEREAFKAAGFDAKQGLINIFGEGSKQQSNNINVIMKQIEENLSKRHADWTKAPQEEVFEELNNALRKHWDMSDRLFGSAGIPTESRQFRWSKQIMDKVGPAFEWIKEAPARRLGGIAAVGLGIMAGANLLFGDSTPTSINDIPSRSSNPLLGERGGTYGMGGSVSGSMNLNSNVGLLSSSSAPHINVISSINSIIGNKGGHSVSMRNDNTNPYLDKMSYYN